MVNLADRGFPSVERYLVAAAAGADLVWRWKNDPKGLPAKTLEALPGGPELVTFSVVTRTASGRSKTTRARVLATLPGHEELPAREITGLHAQRWQIEIAFLHLESTVRGGRRELHGQSPALDITPNI